MTSSQAIGELIYIIAFTASAFGIAALIYGSTWLLDLLFGLIITLWVKIRCLFKRH